MISSRPVHTVTQCPTEDCEGEWEFDGTLCSADPPAGHPTAYVDWDVEHPRSVVEHTCDRTSVTWEEVENELLAESNMLVYGCGY